MDCMVCPLTGNWPTKCGCAGGMVWMRSHTTAGCKVQARLHSSERASYSESGSICHVRSYNDRNAQDSPIHHSVQRKASLDSSSCKASATVDGGSGELSAFAPSHGGDLVHAVLHVRDVDPAAPGFILPIKAHRTVSVTLPSNAVKGAGTVQQRTTLGDVAGTHGWIEGAPQRSASANDISTCWSYNGHSAIQRFQGSGKAFSYSGTGCRPGWLPHLSVTYRCLL